MQINGLENRITWQKTPLSTNVESKNDISTSPKDDKTSFTRQLARDFDPTDMSPNDALKLANKLIMSGERELSSVFVPLPPIKRSDNGGVINLTGTPEGEKMMNTKKNLIEGVKIVIEYKKSENQPTELYEKGLTFLEKLQAAQNSNEINLYA